MNSLFRVIGISKQAVHYYAKKQLIYEQQLQNLIIEAEQLKA